MTIAADLKHLGARVGMTSVLHTWGSALTHHPHVHMIVPGGGLAPDAPARYPAAQLLPTRASAIPAVPASIHREAALLYRASLLVFFGDLAELAYAEAFAA